MRGIRKNDPKNANRSHWASNRAKNDRSFWFFYKKTGVFVQALINRMAR